MKIMLVNTWRVINAKGGTERVFSEMSNALSRFGHTVLAVCDDKHKGVLGFPIDKKVEFLNLGEKRESLFFSGFFRNLYALSFSKKVRDQKRAQFNALKFCNKLKNEMDAFRPDVIISFQPMSTYFLTKVRGGCPIITMLHNKPDVYLPPELSSTIKAAVAQSNFVQVLRPEFVEQVKEILPGVHAVVIPNFVEKQEKVANLHSHKIINVGRITEDKRQLLLAEAFNLIKDRFPDWIVDVWGETTYDNVYTDKVLRYIRENKLEGRFNLKGATSNVIGELATGSVFAFPSHHEGWGLALTEAMSLGLPAIGCKNCPAVNTLIESGVNGLLCEDTPQDLANSLSLLIENECLRKKLGERAKQDMLKFTPETVWNIWNSLIIEVSSSHRSGL